MRKEFPGGVWPVMLTPFKENGEVDYRGLEALVNWYIEKSGRFICSMPVQRNVLSES